MDIVLFTSNRTGVILLKKLKGKGICPHTVTYAKGFQRTGLAEDFSLFGGDFPLTYISSSSFAECSFLPDIIKGKVPVCVDWTKDFFNGADFPVICAHPSLLPMYRGYSAVTEQFLRGVAVGGASLYIRNEQIDGGDIVFQQKIRIEFNDYPADFLDKYTDACASFIAQLITADISQLKPVRQDSESSFYLQRKRTRDALIDFSRDAFSLYNHIRAFSRPYFGAYFMLNGQKVTVWRAFTEKWQGDYGEPGTILDITGDSIEVACGSGTILFTEMQGFDPDNASNGTNLSIF